MIDLKEEFNKTGMLLDKTTQTLTAFPYDFDSIKIKTNDYVTDKVINESIKKLHYNFLFLYRACNVNNFDVFDAYYFTLSSIDTDPYYKQIYDEYTSMTTSNSLITATSASVILPYNRDTQSSYIFMAEPEAITCMQVGTNVLRLIFKTENVDPLSGDIKFKTIVDLKSDNYDNLYVVDSAYNSIYQYNINSFVSNEYIYREKLFLKNLIGGLGKVDDNNKFNGIKNIALGDAILVVQDAGNSCFKIFDKNLNWLNTSVFVLLFEKETYFQAMLLDKNNNLYCGVGNKIYKFRFLNDSNQYEFDGVIVYNNFFESGEFIRGLHRVPSNENIFYIQTNLSIKKVWFSSLDFVIGQFNYSNNIDRDIKWMSVTKFDGERDILALYTLKNNQENFSFNLDKTYINTLLNTDRTSIYALDDLLIKKDEYVQSWVILSKLSKIYYNIFILLQNIKYKYSEISGLKYPIIDKKIYNRGFLGYLNSLTYDKNFDIGVNEIFQNDIINRLLVEIYNFQLILMLYIINNSSQRIYLSPDPFIDTPISKRYLYYADESLILIPNPAQLNIFEELGPGAGILISLGGAPISSDDSISIIEGVNI